MHLTEFPSGPNKRRDGRRLNAKNAVRATSLVRPPSRLLFAVLLGPLRRALTVPPRRPKALKVVRYSASVRCSPPPCRPFVAPSSYPRGRNTLLRITYTSTTKTTARRKPVAPQIFELAFSFTVSPSFILPKMSAAKRCLDPARRHPRFIFSVD